MRIRGLCKLLDGRDWLWGKLGIALVVRAMLSKSLIQFSVDGWGWVPSLLFTCRAVRRYPLPKGKGEAPARQ